MTDATAAQPHAEPRPGARTVSSDDPFARRRELVMRHGGLLYRLRLTRAGSPILTK
jgi:hemin uptake protein HemP